MNIDPKALEAVAKAIYYHGTTEGDTLFDGISDDEKSHLRGQADAAITAYLSAPASGRDETQALRDVKAERRRQISVEGWSPQHDDEHDTGEMALAAACYAVSAAQPDEHNRQIAFARYWRWGEKWWKPRSPREDLIRAGALILAEIERLDRSTACAALAQGEKE